MNQQLNNTTTEDKIEAFVGQVVNDIAAAYSGVLTKVGHSLGLYKAMAQNGTISSVELAEKTGTSQRYVLEWLNNQAAGGYIDYDPVQGRYKLPVEHVPVLADEDSPFFLAGSLGSLTAIYKIEEKLTEAFKTGGGIGWHEQDESLFYGTGFLFRTGYKAHLTSEWIPALTGIDEKLKTGGTVADVGLDTAPPVSSWPRTIPRRLSYGTTIIRNPLMSHASAQKKQASKTESVSRWLLLKTTPVRITISSALWIACTIYEIRSVLPGMLSKLLPRVAPCSWWNPILMTASSRTYIPSAVSFTLLRQPLHAELAISGSRKRHRSAGRRSPVCRYHVPSRFPKIQTRHRDTFQPDN